MKLVYFKIPGLFISSIEKQICHAKHHPDSNSLTARKVSKISNPNVPSFGGFRYLSLIGQTVHAYDYYGVLGCLFSATMVIAHWTTCKI